jgi:S1-C subfamily serine protease
MALQALLLLSVLGNPGETVLLEFTSAGCAPCRMMQPVVQRLHREGYPVRQVNIATDRKLATQFRVYQVPCFVMVVQGREVERVVGATTYTRLVSMVRDRGGERTVSVPSRSRMTSVPVALQPVSIPAKETSAVSAVARNTVLSPQQRAMAATVRLRVEDSRGTSYGTGTIIDRHGADALVLTCGHIFRDSAGSGTIQIDFFVKGAVRTVRGELVAYDAQHDDVGLVSMRPGVEVTPVAVAAAGVTAARGQQVFAIGCSRGAGPTVLSSEITGVNRFVGSPNFTVRGRPKDGRSGGGLFTAEGQLIGLCKWAVTDADEGVYAGLSAVHQQLSRAGLQSLLKTAATSHSSAGSGEVPTSERVTPPTLSAAPRPGANEITPVRIDSSQDRQAEYAAKLQAINRAYEIARESLRREYQEPRATVTNFDMAIRNPAIPLPRVAEPGPAIMRGQSPQRR